MVYEGIGHMVHVSGESGKIIQNLMHFSNMSWSETFSQVSTNQTLLLRPDVIKKIDFNLKINQRVAESVGPAYIFQLRNIFRDLLELYSHYSQCVSTSVQQHQFTDMLKPMRLVRRDILRLISAYIDKETNFSIFNEQFLPTLKSLIDDYRNSDPQARDPEVLMLFAMMFKKNGEVLAQSLEQIQTQLCEPTLQMIKDDYVNFPEFRESLFTLTEKIVKHCTAGLFGLNMGQLTTFILTILFAMKHEKPEAMEIGLNTMVSLN